MKSQIIRKVEALERLLLNLESRAEATRSQVRQNQQIFLARSRRKLTFRYTPPPADCTYWGPLKFTVYWQQAQGPYFEHTLGINNPGESVTVGNETYSMVRNFEAYALSYRKTQNPSDITFSWSINHSQLNVSCGGGFTHDFGFNSAGNQNPSGSGNDYRLVIQSI